MLKWMLNKLCGQEYMTKPFNNEVKAMLKGCAVTNVHRHGLMPEKESQKRTHEEYGVLMEHGIDSLLLKPSGMQLPKSF